MRIVYAANFDCKGYYYTLMSEDGILKFFCGELNF